MGVMTVSSQNFMEIDMPGWWLSGASVDLDFRNGRYYDSSNILAGLSNLLSISRASIGYARTIGGTLTQFSSGQFRQTDAGLLIEDARTNRFIHSQEFNDAAWSATSYTVAVDQIAAPDGTVTAEKITVSSTSGPYVRETSQVNTTGSYAVSFHIMAGAGASWALIQGGEWGANMARAWFNLANGSIGSTQATGTMVIDGTSIEALGNGWYRLTLVAHDTSAGGGNFFFAGISGCISGDTSLNAANIGDYCYIWGAQIELGSFSSSYIPTTTTSATRAADSVSIAGSAQTAINNATGSIVAWVNGSPAPVFPSSIVDSNGTNLLGYDATDHGLTSITSALATSNTANAGGRDKFGTAWDAAGRRLVLNGGTVATDAVAQTPSATQKLGSASGTSNFVFSYVDRLALWNTKLASATLQALTT